MTRRRPSALAAISRIPQDIRTILMVLGMVAAFVILGFVLMAGPAETTDKRIEQLQHHHERTP